VGNCGAGIGGDTAAAAAAAAATMGWFEALWRHVTATYSHRQIAVVGSTLLHEATYIILLLVAVAMANCKALDKYSIQKKQNVTVGSIMQCLRLVVPTQLLLEIPLYCLIPIYLELVGIPFDYESIPSAWVYMWKMPACLIIEDTWHYFLHRLLHHPSIYGHVHKVHHTYTAPYGIVAEYAHPIETIVLGLGFFCGVFVLADHMVFLFLWFFVRMIQTHEAHLGYALPYNPLRLVPFYGGAEAHDLHHKVFDCNYGSTFTWWDHAFGTYCEPRARMARLNAKSSTRTLTPSGSTPASPVADSTDHVKAS